MTTQSSCAIVPVVSIVNNVPTTLSTDVASFFGKIHRDVIRAIETIIARAPSNRVRNFAQTFVTRANPKNPATQIQSKAYRLTKAGFMFLAMGFTGAKADALKWSYIDEFDRMEEQLRRHKQCPVLDQLETLTPAQQDAIRKKVAERALLSTTSYKTIYKALHLRFQVPRFELIPRDKFIEALNFIRDVELKVPVVQQPKPDACLFSYDPAILTSEELRSLANLIYLLDLAKPTYKQVYAGLRTIHSDLSPRFYSLITETFLSESAMKRVLDRNQVDYPLPYRGSN